jgi:hypothetical protein
MVNYALFKSATACSAMQIAAILYSQPPPLYSLFLLGGIATSLLNHATTSRIWRGIDRSYMTIGIPITFLIAPQAILQAAPFIAASLYLLGKRWASLHIAAHIAISATNICICFWLQN